METGDIVALAFLAGIAFWFIRRFLWVGRQSDGRWTSRRRDGGTRRCDGAPGAGPRAAPAAPATRRRARVAAWRGSPSSAGGAPRGRARDRARSAARAWRRADDSCGTGVAACLGPSRGCTVMTFGIAWAQISATAPPAATPAASGGSAAVGFLVILGLPVLVGIAVKLYDRKRDAGAVHPQAQDSDPPTRDARLAGLGLTPAAPVPAWGRGPATIEISREGPHATVRDAVQRVAREAAARLRPDVQIQDRLTVRRTVAA